MAEDLIRYDILTQEALRGVVRKVLSEVVKAGLPGEHHFFITFVTRAPGVKLSRRLLDQYEQEMTIVLQNQFWDLKVTDHGFEVGLSFDQQPEMLVIPYGAIKGFFDPSVPFGMQFDVDGHAPAEEDAAPEQKETTAAPAAGDEAAGDKVVSLDAFRKKP